MNVPIQEEAFLELVEQAFVPSTAKGFFFLQKNGVGLFTLAA